MIRSATAGAYLEGQPVVVLDERLGNAPASLIVAAEAITADVLAFVVRYTSGFVTIGLPAWRCDQLDLPAIAADAHYLTRPIAAVSVDAAEGVSTGISAADRSRTARLLADPATTLAEFTRPGHLVPLRVPPPIDGSITSAAAAGLALCDLAGVALGAVCCELLDEAGELTGTAEARLFAARHGLFAVSLRDVEMLMRSSVPATRIA